MKPLLDVYRRNLKVPALANTLQLPDFHRLTLCGVAGARHIHQRNLGNWEPLRKDPSAVPRADRQPAHLKGSANELAIFS